MIGHSEFFADLNEASETVDVVRVLVVDLLVDLQGFVEEIHSSVARSDHELPLDFLGLDLACSFEVENCFLEHVLLCVVHSETRDYINFGWVVSVTLLVVMHGLEFVLLLLVEVAHLGQDLGVSWHFGNEDVVPLEGLSSHSDELVHVSNLVNHLVTVWDDSVKLFEGLKTLVVVTKAFVDQTQVVNGLDAVSLDSNSL